MILHLHPSRAAQRRALEASATEQGVLLGQVHLTYPEWFDQLFAHLQLGPAPIGPVGRQVILKEALLGLQKEGGLAAGFGAAGWTHTFTQVISELKQAALHPEDLRETRLDLGGTDAVEAEEIHIVEEVFGAYQWGLDFHGFIDEDDRDIRLLSYFQIEADRIVSLPILRSIRRLVLHNLYRLSVVQHGILSRIIRVLPEGAVLVHFTRSENISATELAERTWQRFVEDEALADKALPLFTHSENQGEGVLETIKNRLFAYPSARTIPAEAEDGSLEVWEVSGRYREVEEIGREIRRLLDQKVPVDRIAVLLRNLDLYAEMVEDVFHRFRIPFHLRRQPPLFHLPVIKWIFSLLELPIRDYERKALLKVLCSGYLRWKNGSPADVSALLYGCNYLRPGLRPLEACLPADSALSEEVMDRAREIRTRADTLNRSDQPFCSFVEGVSKWIDDLRILPNLIPHEKVPSHLVDRDRRGLLHAFHIIEEIAFTIQRMGNRHMPYTEFLQWISQILASVTLPSLPELSREVSILGVGDALGLTFEHVFIPGLVDTEFPQSSRENPILSDRARGQLNRMARRILPERYPHTLERPLVSRVLLLSSDATREEPLLFYLGLQCATKRSVLSFINQRADGQPLKPSLFIDEVLRHFSRGEKIVRRMTHPSFHALDANEWLKGIARRWRTLSLPSKQDGKRLEPLVDRLRESVGVLRSQLGISETPAYSSAALPYHGDLSGHLGLIRTLLGPTPLWSPTQLDTAGACRFAFFSKHLLGLRPREAPEEDLPAPLLGSLVHQVIEKYLQGDIGEDHLREEEKILLLMKEAAARPGQPELPAAYDYWVLREKEVADTLVAFVHYHQACLSKGERALFVEESLEGGLTTVDRTHHRLGGRCDLVYAVFGPDGICRLRVEDLKFSRSASRYRRYLADGILGKSSFQLPVYAYLALERLLRDQAVLTANLRIEGQYTLLRYSGSQPKTEDLLDMVTTGKKGLFSAIDRLIQSILSGDFHPSPHPILKPCEQCRYGALCRYPWTNRQHAFPKDDLREQRTER